MASMRFVTFESAGKLRPGIISDIDTVLDLSSIGFQSLIEFIEAGPDARAKAETLADQSPAAAKHRLKDVELRAPIPKPRKLICVGLNYRDHAVETGAQIPKVPTIFNKFATAVIGPGANIVLPKASNRPTMRLSLPLSSGVAGVTLPRKIGPITFSATPS